MKILHTVEFYSPHVGGAQEVVRQVSERLAERGHDVTVATSRLSRPRENRRINGVTVAEFGVRGNAARGMHGAVEDYQHFVREGGFDVVMNYAAQQWTTDAMIPLLGRLDGVTVLAPCGFSGLRDLLYRRYFRQMPAVLRQYDGIVFHSSTYQDAAFAMGHGITNYTVIPNGASPEEFNDLGSDFRMVQGIPQDAFLVVTIGSHTGLKGHRELLQAFRRADIPGAVLLLIGNIVGTRGCLRECKVRRSLHALTSRSSSVVLADLPRAEVVAALKSADLFAFPSNIECSPIVVCEAMASGLPFVATPAGNMVELAAEASGGVVVRSRQTRSGRVRADPTDLSCILRDLAQDPQARRSMGSANRAAWQEHHQWDRIAIQYEEYYRRLLALGDA